MGRIKKDGYKFLKKNINKTMQFTLWQIFNLIDEGDKESINEAREKLYKLIKLYPYLKDNK